MKKYTYALEGKGRQTVTLINKSSHRIIPTIVSSGDVAIIRGNIRYAISAGEFSDERIMLSKGVTQFDIENPLAAAVTVEIKFIEEVQ